jgi:hypothetical protein
MGNRAVVRAIERIAQGARKRGGKRFGQIILAGADVDADVFRQRCVAFTRTARRTTMYVSSRDRAIEAAGWLYGFPRAGLMPPVLVAPGIDTIGVSNVDITQLGHGYVAESREVLHDIYELIRHDVARLEFVRIGLRSLKSRMIAYTSTPYHSDQTRRPIGARPDEEVGISLLITGRVDSPGMADKRLRHMVAPRPIRATGFWDLTLAQRS